MKLGTVSHDISRLPLPPSSSPIPQEILHQMYEQGPQFTLKDYTNAIKLLSHSQPVFESDKLDLRIQALETYFSKDSV